MWKMESKTGTEVYQNFKIHETKTGTSLEWKKKALEMGGIGSLEKSELDNTGSNFYTRNKRSTTTESIKLSVKSDD
jgi:hypothetical protein